MPTRRCSAPAATLPLQHEFGQPVSDDETLDDQREVWLALAVPGVTGDSFDKMVVAMLIVDGRRSE